MIIRTISTTNGTSPYIKAYKTIANARIAIKKLKEELKDFEGAITYAICVNDNDRFFIQINYRHDLNPELSFHWLINKGHHISVTQ